MLKNVNVGVSRTGVETMWCAACDTDGDSLLAEALVYVQREGRARRREGNEMRRGLL